jgi:hypothetical protein
MLVIVVEDALFGETDTTEKQHGQGVKADEYVDVAGLVIHSARYGAGSGDLIDVTERLQSLVTNDSLDITVNNSTLTPGQNPYRGKRKTLQVIYSYDGGARQGVVRDEKEWLIIGQAQRGAGDLQTAELIRDREDKVVGVARELPQGGTVVEDVTIERGGDEYNLRHLSSYSGHRVVDAVINLNPPRTATALNDYLIRKFQISPQRLRAPMPIELRDFHRNDLAALFAELGFRKGAEVGVAEGRYSEVLLKANPKLELHMVDPWHSYSDNPQNKSKEKHEFAYQETLRRTRDYKMAIPIMQESMEYVRQVVDESLDFCYIDGNHLFDYVMQDLIEWSKRVRSGGLVTGDDYYTLDQSRWRGGGVVEAVNAYVNAHQISPWFVFQGHKSVDFMWVKP